ncbi:MAG: hypothetical protein RIE86_02935 [Imperialibacter sp.]
MLIQEMTMLLERLAFVQRPCVGTAGKALEQRPSDAGSVAERHGML